MDEIKLMNIEQIMNIDVTLDKNDVESLKSILSKLNLNFTYKSLLLCSYLFEVEPNEVKDNRPTARKHKNVYLARFMWFKILYDHIYTQHKEISKQTGFLSNAISVGLYRFEGKLKKSKLLRDKYDTVLAVLNDELKIK